MASEHGPTRQCTLCGLAWIDGPITDKQHAVAMIGWAHWNPSLTLGFY